MDQYSGDPQVQGPMEPRRSSRPVVILVVVGLVSTLVCVAAVLGVRWYQARSAGAAVEAAEAGPAAAAQPATVRAVVTLPEGQPKGIMRQAPAFDAPVVVLLPAGAELEVTNSVVKGGQTWCRVRTMGPPEASGWMHGNIVRFQ